VARQLIKYGATNIVVDPVMVAQSGDKLLQDDAIEALKEHLLPLADVVTPNLPETAVLLDRESEGIKDFKAAAIDLARYGSKNILIKGGHLEGTDSSDLLYLVSEDRFVQVKGKRIKTRNNHGTGCTLSSAIAAYLAKGNRVDDAVKKAKIYITEAIRKGADYTLGYGHGPVHHFFKFWNA
jgi:hydroxymethylpyrimidine/phosphomethylpyrimidine kinase